ncbi:hypothetical protein [Kosakonia pseudosacchari]|uniref:hypothetical protein n=1 Tax=Kosakonia pseudosacchari TaxID=1646340 RepID=UPI00117BBF7A|nr:hypothetical protein [Kosakonia pseudosacchari]
MLRIFIASVFCMLWSLNGIASQTFHQGVLQAYWLPVFNDDGIKKTAQLKYRYFVINNAGKVEKTINVNINNGERQLEKYFPRLPSTFKQFSEGHTEQSGQITIDTLKKQTECDRPLFSANAMSFSPISTPSPSVDTLERAAGCESWPWAETFILKEGVKDLHLKSQPDDGAKNLQVIKSAQPLIKMKTVNEKWIRVAILDEKNGGPVQKTEGYIRLNELQPIN